MFQFWNWYCRNVRPVYRAKRDAFLAFCWSVFRFGMVVLLGLVSLAVVAVIVWFINQNIATDGLAWKVLTRQCTQVRLPVRAEARSPRNGKADLWLVRTDVTGVSYDTFPHSTLRWDDYMNSGRMKAELAAMGTLTLVRNPCAENSHLIGGTIKTPFYVDVYRHPSTNPRLGPEDF